MLGNVLEGTFSVKLLVPTSFFISLYIAPINKSIKMIVKSIRKKRPKHFFMLTGMLKGFYYTAVFSVMFEEWEEETRLIMNRFAQWVSYDLQNKSLLLPAG